MPDAGTGGDVEHADDGLGGGRSFQVWVVTMVEQPKAKGQKTPLGSTPSSVREGEELKDVRSGEEMTTSGLSFLSIPSQRLKTI